MHPLGLSEKNIHLSSTLSHSSRLSFCCDILGWRGSASDPTGAYFALRPPPGHFAAYTATSTFLWLSPPPPPLPKPRLRPCGCLVLLAYVKLYPSRNWYRRLFLDMSYPCIERADKVARLQLLFFSIIKQRSLPKSVFCKSPVECCR